MGPFLGIICLLVVLIVCGFIFVYLALRESSVLLDENGAITVVKLIEAIREVCPVGSSKGWTLLFNHWGARCWSQLLPFDILGAHSMIYGSSVTISASATSVLNVIADVSSWKEWDPSMTEDKQLKAATVSDVRLQSDEYMQCDRLLLDKRSSLPQVHMYRFGQIEKNGVGWILHWEVQRLYWCFFLAQPIENVWNDHPSQCLVTAIQGYNPELFKNVDIPKELVNKLLGIKDAVKGFYLKAHPFQSLSSSSESQFDMPQQFPITDHSYKAFCSVPCKLLQKRLNRSPMKLGAQHRKDITVLTLVPFGTAKPVTLTNHKGFALFRWPKIDSSPSSHHSTPRHRPKIRYEARSRSGSFSMKRSSAHGHAVKQRALSADARMQDSPVSARSESVVDNKSHFYEMGSNHSFGLQEGKLDVMVTEDCIIADSSQKDKIEDDQSQQSSSESSSTDENDETFQITKQNGNETPEGEDFEVLLPFHNMSEDRITAFKTTGNRCVSELLSEVIKASVIELHNPPEVQKAATGGWAFERTHRDVTVLNKVRPFGSLTTTSYLSKAVIPEPPNVVWAALQNPLTRYMYDETLKRIRVIEEFPNGQKILHTFHESTTLLKKEAQDFCLLHTKRKEGSKLIVAFQSIEYENCPLMEDTLRGMILPSGWVVEPYVNDDTCCVVSYLLQILVNSPEHLVTSEIGNTQPNCITNLSNYLSAKPH